MIRMFRRLKSPYKDVVEIAAAFLVAWLFYNALAFVTGTQLPIVSVVSDSMYHGPNDWRGEMCGAKVSEPKNFNGFWGICGGAYDKLGITKEDFRKFSFPNGLSKGDMLFVVKPDDVGVGDMAIYQRTKNSITIIHRIVRVDENGYVFKGDNNAGLDEIVKKEQIIGKVLIGMPLLGYPRLALYAIGI